MVSGCSCVIDEQCQEWRTGRRCCPGGRCCDEEEEEEEEEEDPGEDAGNTDPPPHHASHQPITGPSFSDSESRGVMWIPSRVLQFSHRYTHFSEKTANK